MVVIECADVQHIGVYLIPNDGYKVTVLECSCHCSLGDQTVVVVSVRRSEQLRCGNHSRRMAVFGSTFRKTSCPGALTNLRSSNFASQSRPVISSSMVPQSKLQSL